MDQNAIDRLNGSSMKDAVELSSVLKAERANAYFQLVTGLVTVIAMIVVPIVIQYNGVDFEGEGIQYGASIWACLVGVALIVMWVWRIRSENRSLRERSDSLLRETNEMARALTDAGYGPVDVDDSGPAPQLVLVKDQQQPR